MCVWGEGERLENMRGEGSKKRKEIIEVEDTEDGDDEEDAQPLQKVARSKLNFVSVFAIFLLTSKFCRRKFSSRSSICGSGVIEEDERENGGETEDGYGGSDNVGGHGGGKEDRVGEVESEGDDV
jgi:hypothetical protein